MQGIILSFVLANSLLNPEYVTCSLWKYTETEQDGKICIYLGKNKTIAYHYAQKSFRECPHQFQCRYSPNSKPKIRIKDILKGLSDGF